jgi:hypothetical protein
MPIAEFIELAAEPGDTGNHRAHILSVQQTADAPVAHVTEEGFWSEPGPDLASGVSMRSAPVPARGRSTTWPQRPAHSAQGEPSSLIRACEATSASSSDALDEKSGAQPPGRCRSWNPRNR